jgi:hypothetical protein
MIGDRNGTNQKNPYSIGKQRTELTRVINRAVLLF